MAASEESLLLRAVLDAPGEDGPRLAYADGCAWRGDAARAEFIRLQCELGHMNWGEPRDKPLYERMKELLEAHFEEWVGALQPVVAPTSFWRGFIESAHGSPQRLLEKFGSRLDQSPLSPIRP